MFPERRLNGIGRNSMTCELPARMSAMGSLADITARSRHVRFTLPLIASENSDFWAFLTRDRKNILMRALSRAWASGSAIIGVLSLYPP